MYLLFETEEENLADFFSTIDDDDIVSCTGQKIFYRGEEYYEHGLVMDTTFNHYKTKLEAFVKGTEKYGVSIVYRDGKVFGECDCPYEGVCKHLVATMLYTIFEEVVVSEVIEVQSKDKKQSVKEYLEGFSKQQLIDLVLKYAPDQFFTKIDNKSKDKDTAKKILERVNKDFQNIFLDEDLLYNIFDFDASINKTLLRLSGLETQLQKEIQSIIIEIIDKVGDLTDEGYLYEHYEDECYEPSQPFFDFIENYVKSLTFTQKTDFFEELDVVLSRQEYNTFDELIQLSQIAYNETDLPFLKNTLMEQFSTQPVSLTVNYYKQVRGLLNKEERQAVLEQIKFEDENWLIELTELYKSENNLDKAITVTKNWLQAKSGFYLTEKVYSSYLDMLKESDVDFTMEAKEALSNRPSFAMIEKIKSLVDDTVDQYEDILKKKAPHEMLIYLEHHNRLKEALKLIQTPGLIWEDNQNRFFKKYKNLFSENAQTFFKNIVDKNLLCTGDNYYYNIADAIKQLKTINPVYTKHLLEDIRNKFKRRRNLMKILEKL